MSYVERERLTALSFDRSGGLPLPALLSLGLLFQCQGLVEALGASTMLYRGVVIVAAAAVLAICFREARQSAYVRWIGAGAAVLATATVFSALINGTSPMALAVTLYRDAFFVLTLMAFIALGRRTSRADFIKFIAAFAALFVVVSLIKLSIYGVDEKVFIGTLSMTAGQLGIIYPSGLVPLFLYLSPVYGLLISGALGLTSVIHEKRIVIVLFPLLLVGGTLLVLARDQFLRRAVLLRQSAARIAGSLSVSALIIVLSISGIPSLNPESVRGAGGEVDLGYVRDYVVEYTTRDYVSKLNNPIENLEEDTAIQVGRLRMFPMLLNWSSDRPIAQQALGNGPATVDRTYILGEDRIDIFFDVTGIRGPVTLFHELLVERGWLGVVVFFLPFAVLLSTVAAAFAVLLKKRQAPPFSLWVVAWTGFVIAFDLAGYSTISYLIPAGAVIFGLALGRWEVDRNGS